MEGNRNGKSGRRIAALMSVLLLILSFLMAGCEARESQENGEKKDKLNVVTTLFPYYDFLRQIAGDDIELTMVVPAGMDSHSFEPTPADMITIQNADLLICNGGEMEQWLSRILDSFGDGPAPGRVVTMMDYVDTVEEEVVEGMEAEEHDHSTDRRSHAEEEDLDHSHADEEDLDHSHAGEEDLDHSHADENDLAHSYVDGEWINDGHEVEIEYDEHIWTSPVNAMKLTQVLAEVLAEEDPEHAADYRAGSDTYIEKLREVDREFRQIVSDGHRRLLVFGDKFPLRYFFEEYGLEYRAAFTGCSSDTEPSAQTIAYLIDKVRDGKIPVIYYLELSSHRVAEIIGEETGAEPLLFHSCHNVTRKQFDSGITYLELMEQNAVNLRKGLK